MPDAMTCERDGFLISTEQVRLDIDFITHSLNGTYWAKGRPREIIEASIRNSICFGVYENETRKQVGFARVVTDQATFSWICDVFIEEKHRRKGLGKWLMECVTAHPCVKNSLSFLGTADAQGLYEKYGYKRSELMRRLPDQKHP
jgi:GNAT superfamily N-acetyltransferase